MSCTIIQPSTYLSDTGMSTLAYFKFIRENKKSEYRVKVDMELLLKD